MSDESQQQMTDALRENTEMMRALGQSQAMSVEIMKKLAQAQGVNIASLKAFDADLKSAGDATKQSTLYQKSQQQALERYLQAQQNLTNAVTSSVTSMKSLGGALLSTEKSLSKFGSGLTSAGEAAWSLGKNFGLVGMAIGGLVKGATMAADAALKQTDASLKATDELSALGAAGGLTAKEVLEMGHNAGLSSQNLEIFTKAATRAGSGLAGFGNTVTDGVKAFSQMTAVTKEQRMAFERMGIGQERLMEMQGDYVKLQELSGKSLQGQAGDSAKLKKESLEYIENLTRLSAMTGKSADKLQKEQEARQLEYEELIQTRQEDDKIRELRAQGRGKEADALELEQKKRQEYLREVEAVYGRDMAMKVGRVARTGGYDKQTAGLAVLGLDAGKIQQDIKGAKDLDEARRNAAIRNQEIKGLQSEGLKSFGTALQYGGKGMGDKMGLGEESIRESSKFAGRNELEAYEASKRQTGAPSQGQTSDKVAKDPAQEFRNEMTEAGIAARKKVDELVLAMNPMMSGFNSITLAATGLTGAAVLAASALAGMAAKAKMGDLLDQAGTPGPGSKGGGGKAGGLLRGLGGLGRVAKVAAGGIGGLVGGMALDYGASKAEAAGHTKTAAGLDTGSYALKGAGIGALLGPMGAAAGGALGGAYGLYQNWGKLFGGKTPTGAAGESGAIPEAKAMEDLEKKTQEAQKDQTKATTNLDFNTKESNRQLDINTKALLDLTDALNDLTIVTSAKTASGSPEQIQKMLEGIYNKRGIGSGTPSSGTTGGVSGSGASGGGGGSASPSGAAAPGTGTPTTATTSEPGGKVGGAGEGKPAPQMGGKPVSGDVRVKTVMDSGPGWIKLEKEDGGAILRKGAANWRMNNPGNIRFGSFAKSHGAIGVGDAGPSGQFAVFPSLAAGLTAKEQLLFNPKSKYYNLSIWDAMHRYAPESDNNKPAQYAEQVAKGAGVTTQTLLRDMTSSQRQGMLDAINKHEGFREGITLSAKEGALLNGPSSGYPVNLTAHGSEAIVPLDPNTLLGKLAKEPISSSSSSTETVKTITSSNEVMISFMDDFRSMMEEKFDDMIDALNEGNSISDKILTYSKV